MARQTEDLREQSLFVPTIVRGVHRTDDAEVGLALRKRLFPAQTSPEIAILQLNLALRQTSRVAFRKDLVLNATGERRVPQRVDIEGRQTVRGCPCLGPG